MFDVRHAALATIALAGTIACLLMMDLSRHAVRRGALEWRRDRALQQAQFPGPFRLGVLLMQGAGIGFLAGAVRAATALLDVVP